MFFTSQEEMHQIKGTVFDRPPTTFDPILSYRWNPGFRYVRVANGEIVCDLAPAINNEGFHCSFDYEHEKRDRRTFRFIVLGDSFTNDLAVNEAWPETLQYLLQSRAEHGINVEVYGMPTDGGGLPNWNTTLKEFVVPNYEFDGLILADWGDDLSRDWVICHSTEEGMFWDRVDLTQRPTGRAEVEGNLGGMQKLYGVRPGSEIDELVAKLREHAKPKRQTPDDCYSTPEMAPDGYEFSPGAFAERYSPERLDLFAEIVDICRQREAPVIYSTLPTRPEVLSLNQNASGKLFRQAQGEGLCRHFDIAYFDGCSVFGHVDPQSLIDLYWLKYDGHWSKAASMQYALSLADWIVAQGIVARDVS